MHEFHTQRRVEFADTDMARICHFARYAVFMETAEHEMLAALGQSVHMKVDGKEIGWPRVRVQLEYLRPARFGDVLDIHVRVLRKGNKSVTYAFTFSRNGEEVARGEIVSTCCVLDEETGPSPIPIPSSIADRLEEAPG